VAIPKVIYQTFRDRRLPLHTRWYIARMKQRNSGYAYEFYDDARIEDFILKEYGPGLCTLFRRIQIGAAKADLFRYLILYRFGGIYLDIDSRMTGRADHFLRPLDEAVLAKENLPEQYFVQWALVYSAGHPFLKRTIEKVTYNLENNLFPHNSHSMTGPKPYTEAIRECLQENPAIPWREMEIDYKGFLKFKYPLSKLMYRKGEHWKEMQKTVTVMRPE